jgi:dTDP-glucose pyrophosphorylase
MNRLDQFETHLWSPSVQIRSALQFFNDAYHQLLLVVDSEARLLGTVTDGDIRRAILQGATLDDPISACMYHEPTVGHVDKPEDHTDLIRGLPFLPVVDRRNRVAAIMLPLNGPEGLGDAVVMAGGKGTRLGPITERIPKPLLPVGGKPILEHILSNLEAVGVGRIWLTVNHLADQLRDFVDARESVAEINLVEETSRLGTAGSLSLIPGKLMGPVLVLNGDVLTHVDYRALETFHRRSGFDGTIAVAHHRVQVPFGVVRHDDRGFFTGIEEKPMLNHFVAGGIYYLSPGLIALVPSDKQVDMPEILNEAHSVGMRLGLFPIHEYWTDVGHPEDLKAAEIFHQSEDSDQ